MNKILKICFLISVLIFIGLIYQKQNMIYGLQSQITSLNKEVKTQKEKVATYENKGNGVKAHGQLVVKGTSLLDASGKGVQLKGMSSHGLMWFPEYTNYGAINTTKKYGANVFRLAVYSDENKGYIKYPEEAKKLLYMAIENVLAADMYVVVDWHTLEDNDPNEHIEEARTFFDEVSKRYANNPAVLYEICNEPNGDTTWEDVKGYANDIIPIIRKNSKSAVILVGTPKFCTDLESPARDPLRFPNVMYTYHLYTGSSDGYYEKAISDALASGLPIFVSEWGISKEEGSDSLDIEEAKSFLGYLDYLRISWINWSLCNKPEDSAAIAPWNTSLSGWEMKDLSESGKFVFKALK